MQIHVSRAKLVEHAKRLLNDSLNRGPVTGEPHPENAFCLFKRCFETHLLGSGGWETWKGTDHLEGDHYEVLGEYNFHEGKYVEVYAYFPGFLNEGKSVSLTDEVLSSLSSRP